MLSRFVSFVCLACVALVWSATAEAQPPSLPGEAAPALQLPPPAASPPKPKRRPKPKKATDPLERQSRDAGPVYVAPEEAAIDPDFAFVGEYTGSVRLTASARSTTAASLHINATGEGGFTGVLMFGHLPGQPGAAQTGQPLTGRRLGTQAALTGGRFDVVLTNPGPRARAELRVPLGQPDEGALRGTLERIDRGSPTLGQSPPPGAIVLFDGTDTQRLVNGRISPEGWLIEGTETVEPWDDFRLHLEFRLPFKPNAAGQHRGNSGVYLQSRYELQVLDSFGFVPAFNDLGALYRTRRPERIAARPPLQWQTYDIDFRSPEFDSRGERTQPGRLQVWLNGVSIHSGIAIPNKTGAGQPEAGFPLPTKLQSHKNPVRYRNIWLLPRGTRGGFGPAPRAPISPTPVATPLSLAP